MSRPRLHDHAPKPARSVEVSGARRGIAFADVLAGRYEEASLWVEKLKLNDQQHKSPCPCRKPKL